MIGSKKGRALTVYLDGDQLEALQALASKNDRTPSWIVRQALRAYLASVSA